MRKLIMLVIFLSLFLTGCTLFIVEEDTDAYKALSQQYFEYQTNDISNIKNFQTFINNVTLETSIASVKIEVKVYSSLGQLMETRAGSGVIFDETTSLYHVVTDAKIVQKTGTQFMSIEISDYLGNDYQGTLVLTDDSLGLSGIKFTKGATMLKALDIAIQPTLVGEPVMLIGYQRQIINAMTMGLLETYLENDEGEMIGFKTNIPSDDFGNGAVIIDMTHQIIGIQYLASDGQLFAVSYLQIQAFYTLYQNV